MEHKKVKQNKVINDKVTNEESMDPNLSSFLDEINEEFQAHEINKYTKLADLPKNVNYKINNIYKVKTRYGEKIAVDLCIVMLGNENNYTTILPDRYTKLTSVQINILKCSPNIMFRYEGKNVNGNHIINFVKT